MTVYDLIEKLQYIKDKSMTVYVHNSREELVICEKVYPTTNNDRALDIALDFEIDDKTIYLVIE